MMVYKLKAQTQAELVGVAEVLFVASLEDEDEDGDGDVKFESEDEWLWILKMMPCNMFL